MTSIKNPLQWLALPIALALGATVQAAVPKSAAEKAYDSLMATPYDANYRESISLQFRDKAMAFYKRFPHDPLRYNAVQFACMRQGFYLKDTKAADVRLTKFPPVGVSDLAGIPIDKAATAKWDTFRDKVWTDVEKDKSVPQSTRYAITFAILQEKMSYAARTHRFALSKLGKAFVRAARVCPTDDLARLADYMCDPRLEKTFGIETPRKFLAFTKPLLDTRNDGLDAYFYGGAHLIELQSKPVELKFKVMDGTPIDVAKMRGKVVYVDFWSTNCTSCVTNLPVLKSIYDKYRDRGFEVVSIAINIDPERAKVVSLLEKYGITWPNWFSGGPSYDYGPTKDLCNYYGLRSMNAGMLLDRGGNVVGLELTGRELETAVAKCLGATTAGQVGK